MFFPRKGSAQTHTDTRFVGSFNPLYRCCFHTWGATAGSFSHCWRNTKRVHTLV